MNQQLSAGDDEMTHLDAFAILAVVYSKDKTLDPSQFWGKSEQIQNAMANGAQVITEMLRKLCHVHWDGKTPLWKFLIEEWRDQCTCDKAYAMLRVEENNLYWALRVLKGNRVNGNVPLGTIMKAKEIVRTAYRDTVGEEAPDDPSRFNVEVGPVIEPEIVKELV